MNTDVEKFNSFNDKSLHSTIKEEHIIKDDRENLIDIKS
jgi:hypothetical protein